MYTVYILYSSTTQKYYVGQTQNLENRLIEHNAGETKSLRTGMPWSLVWRTIVSTRQESMALEKKLKNIGARRFLATR
jgi:putative endonuclease